MENRLFISEDGRCVLLCGALTYCNVRQMFQNEFGDACLVTKHKEINDETKGVVVEIGGEEVFWSIKDIRCYSLPKKTCSNCMYWEEYRNPYSAKYFTYCDAVDWDDVKNLDKEKALIDADSDDDSGMYIRFATAADFGCNLHKLKTDSHE